MLGSVPGAVVACYRSISDGVSPLLACTVTLLLGRRWPPHPEDLALTASCRWSSGPVSDTICLTPRHPSAGAPTQYHPAETARATPGDAGAGTRAGHSGALPLHWETSPAEPWCAAPPRA